MTVYRTIGWQSKEALDDTVRALQDARGRVSSAQETRITELMTMLQLEPAPAGRPQPEDDRTEVRLNILPEDMCVWVVLPGQTAVMLASDGAVTVPPGYQPSQRDRAIIRALLQTATRENEESGRPEGVQMPYITPPYPSGGF